MKRWVLFSGFDYYPNGGVWDFVGEFDTFEDALAAYGKDKKDWGSILDTKERKVWSERRNGTPVWETLP